MTTKGGWCLTGKHGHFCRYRDCQCDCHEPVQQGESGTMEPITKDGPGGALTPLIPGLDEQHAKGSARRMSQASVPVQTSRVEV